MFFLSQESASMFRSPKADPEGHQRRRTTPLHLAEEAIILLPTQWRGRSLPTEAACLRTLPHLRCLLPRDERLTLTVDMVSVPAMGWLIIMRNTDPASTARQAMMTGVPVLSRHRHLPPQRWFENALEWGSMTRTTAVFLPLLLLPWWGTAAPSDEPSSLLLRQLVMGTDMSGPGSPRCPDLRCMQPLVPGTPTQTECLCHRHHHPDMQAIRSTRM